MSYWLYQHLGNLTPEALAGHTTYLAVRASGSDSEDVLRDFAWRADRTVETTQWSFVRDIGPARLVMIDSRAGRVLGPGPRSIVDAREWDFIAHGAADSDHRHLLLGTSLPWLLARGMHDLEAWNEALCDGAWGALGRRLGERLRQGFDLEHWAAFRDSFERMCRLVHEIAEGRHGPAPATIVALSGDVHHAYLAEVGFGSGDVRSRVYQAVCSPFRNPLASHERAAIRFATGPGGRLVGRVLARSARVPRPPASWRFAHRRPWFDNMVAQLELADSGAANLRIERAVAKATGALELEAVYDRSL